MFDSVGRVVSDEVPDKWQARAGVALALKCISPCLNSTQIVEVFKFYVETGLRDRNYDVVQLILEAAIHTVNEQGKVGFFC